MPLIFRTMTPDGEKPLIGDSARALGIRPGVDIPVSDTGRITPKSGGMSVVQSWRQLQKHRIPRRVGHLVDGKATGNDLDRCWRMGSGEFANGNVASGLQLRVDKPGHGLVEPVVETTLDEYRMALAATRDHWTIDEV